MAFPNWEALGWNAVGVRVEELNGRETTTVYYEKNGWAQVGAEEPSADYILDTVRDMVMCAPQDVAYLAPIVDAFNDQGIAKLDVATLNHDLVIETALRPRTCASQTDSNARAGRS